MPTSAFIVALEKVFSNGLQLNLYRFVVYSVTPTHNIAKQLSDELCAVRGTYAASANFSSP